MAKKEESVQYIMLALEGNEVHKPIGIDPASGKASCIWQQDSFEFARPQQMRKNFESILGKGKEKYVLAWDAPISFSESSYSDRLIDKVARKWVKDKIEHQVFEKKAINARPFSGLSHWVITCSALGYPFGAPLALTELAGGHRYKKNNLHQIIEVHPAVSMGVMWADKHIDIPIPVYKKSKDEREKIVENLNFPKACIESDDVLDAYAAYLMAEMFVNGKAEFLTRPEDGSYVLPLGNSFGELSSIASAMG